MTSSMTSLTTRIELSVLKSAHDCSSVEFYSPSWAHCKALRTAITEMSRVGVYTKYCRDTLLAPNS